MRGLDPGSVHCRKSRSKVIKLLEDADEDPTFSKFQSLPPELRAMVYTIYLQELDTKDAELPVLPPISNVSKELRAEVLPLFYSICTLHIGGNFMGPVTKKLAASKQHLSHFQHVHIPGFERPHATHIVSLELNMPPSGTLPRFSFTLKRVPHAQLGDDATERVEATMDKALQTFVAKLESRKATFLSASDHEENRDKLEKKGLGLQLEDFEELKALLFA